MNPIQNIPTPGEPTAHFLNASQVAKIYGVTPRFILQLAAERKIPCLRLAKKCVRFELGKVAAALEDFKSDSTR